MAITTANMTVASNAAVSVGSDLGSIEKNTLVITPNQEVLDPQIETHLAPRKRFRIGEGAEFAFTLLEPTLENILIAWDTDNSIVTGPPRTLAWGDDQQGDTSRAVVILALEPGGTDVRTITSTAATLQTPAAYNITDQDLSRLPVVYSALGIGATGMIAFSDA